VGAQCACTTSTLSRWRSSGSRASEVSRSPSCSITTSRSSSLTEFPQKRQLWLGGSIDGRRLPRRDANPTRWTPDGWNATTVLLSPVKWRRSLAWQSVIRLDAYGNEVGSCHLPSRPQKSGSPWMIVGESATRTPGPAWRQASAANAFSWASSPSGRRVASIAVCRRFFALAASSAGHPRPAGDDLSHVPRSAISTGETGGGPKGATYSTASHGTNDLLRGRIGSPESPTIIHGASEIAALGSPRPR
jgi:hypothetical protein